MGGRSRGRSADGIARKAAAPTATPFPQVTTPTPTAQKELLAPQTLTPKVPEAESTPTPQETEVKVTAPREEVPLAPWRWPEEVQVPTSHETTVQDSLPLKVAGQEGGRRWEVQVPLPTSEEGRRRWGAVVEVAFTPWQEGGTLLKIPPTLTGGKEASLQVSLFTCRQESKIRLQLDLCKLQTLYCLFAVWQTSKNLLPLF